MSKPITGFKVCQNSKGLLSEVMIEMYFFFIKNKKKIEDLNYSSFVLFETDCVTQADLPRAFGCQAYAPLLLAHL